MSCKEIQRRLLSVTDPRRLPAVVRVHLADCPACRECQQRLTQIERHVSQLPLPTSTAKADLLLRLKTDPAIRRTALRRQLWAQRIPIGAVAATVAALALSVTWWLLTPPAPPAPVAQTPLGPDPWLAELMKRNLSLAKTSTTRDRVEALANLAEDLHGRSEPLARASDADNLKTLADLYGQVVREGVVPRARSLAPDQRGPVLEPIAGRLAAAAAAAEELAREKPDDLKGPLLAIAAAAREGNEELTKAVAAARRSDGERVALLGRDRP